ncbi:MAG: BrnT family toxin [Thermostichus sp. DRC_bins_24]
MAYQWDPSKAKANLRKHGIDFADAVSVFSDDWAITLSEDGYEEDRWVTLGMDGLGRLLVVGWSTPCAGKTFA